MTGCCGYKWKRNQGNQYSREVPRDGLPLFVEKD